MVAAAPAPVDLSFLTGGYGDQPLPQGTAADPTYLAFLRGMGMDQATAWATAVQHVAAVKAQYQTAVSRDPQQLHDELRQTNQPYSDGGAWWSGGRLADVAETRTKDQQRLADLKTAETTGISSEQDQLRSTLEQLARNNVDQIGALQQRSDTQNSQDQYIRALAAASNPQPAAATPLPGSAPVGTGADPNNVAAKLAGMTPAQQALFRGWVAGQPKPPAVPAPKPYVSSGGTAPPA